MLKLLTARYVGNFQVRLEFSDTACGDFDGRALLQRSGSLLEPLRDEAYFERCFVDAGALCWPNGLELSAVRLRQNTRLIEIA
ncbi:MAG: DUF2442 domain-containing protein [Simplicispira sp.]|nr:DUF2442 domain-containing protein [Simplicispira sp.]